MLFADNVDGERRGLKISHWYLEQQKQWKMFDSQWFWPNLWPERIHQVWYVTEYLSFTYLKQDKIKRIERRTKLMFERI